MLRNQKHKLLMIVLGAVVFLGALSGGIYCYNENMKLTAVKGQQELELSLRRNKLRTLPKLEKQLIAMQAEENRLASYLPTKEKQAELILQLNEMASQSGVTIKNCRTQNEPKPLPNLAGYQAYQWEMKISGDYYGLVNFLKLVPDGKRCVMVSGLDVATENEAEQKSMIVADLNLDLVSLSTQTQGTVAK